MDKHLVLKKCQRALLEVHALVSGHRSVHLRSLFTNSARIPAIAKVIFSQHPLPILSSRVIVDQIQVRYVEFVLISRKLWQKFKTDKR